LAKNNTELDFLRQGTKAEESCFVKISQSYFEKTKREKEKFIEKKSEIFPDWSVSVHTEHPYTALAKRNFIGPPTHTGTILYCTRVGTRRGEVLCLRRLGILGN